MIEGGICKEKAIFQCQDRDINKTKGWGGGGSGKMVLMDKVLFFLFVTRVTDVLFQLSLRSLFLCILSKGHSVGNVATKVFKKKDLVLLSLNCP